MAADGQLRDFSSLFYVICFPRDQQVPRKSLMPLLELSNPDSLLLTIKTKAFFLPHIEPTVAALLSKISSDGEEIYNADSDDKCIGVRFKQKVTFLKTGSCNLLIDLLINRYSRKRNWYYLRYETVSNFYRNHTTIIPTSENSHVAEKHKCQVEIADFSVKGENECKIDTLEADFSVKGENKCKIDTLEAYDNLAGRRKRIQLVDLSYSWHKQGASLYKGTVIAEKPEFLFEPLQNKSNKEFLDFVCDKGLDASDGCHLVKKRRKKARQSHIENRYNCQERSFHIGIHERCVFSDSEISDQSENQKQEKPISIKLYCKTTEELRPEIRQHLREITNLPLNSRQWGNPVTLVYPARRKKNERSLDRRPPRSQAQTPSLHAQPSEDDPTPETSGLLSRDRYALPSQPEQSNLHLLSSFTPRIQPVSTSTQQLRRLSSRPRHQQYVDENARRQSFAQWPSSTGQNPENMVSNGFFYTGRLDLIRCHMCGIGLKDWSADDEPLFEHVRHSPDCLFLYTYLGQDVLDAYKAALLPGKAQPAGARHEDQRSQGATNRPESAVGLTSSGDNAGMPLHPEYAELRQRIESFSAWPREATQTQRQMAEAGFYYRGNGDVVHCFHCGGGLQRWDPRDDPWIEHTRWFPHCHYLRQKKGAEYVEMVQRTIRQSTSEEEEPQSGLGDTVGAVANLTIQASASSDPPEPEVTTQTILEMGYSRESLTEAMKKAETKGMINYTPQDLLEILLEMGNEGELTVPQKPKSQVIQESHGATSAETEDDPLFVTIENKSLKKVLKCSECKTRDKNILFLPCTHHCLCEECAEVATKCPVCDVEITRKIRTYMS